MSYPNVLFVSNLNSLKDRRDRHSRSFSILLANRIPVSITFFHLPAILPSFPDYLLPHLSLVQSHEPKSFNHFYISLSIITNHLSRYHSSFLFVIIVLLLLLSLSLFALVSYFVLLICYSAIRLLSCKCGIKLSVSVSDCCPT